MTDAISRKLMDALDANSDAMLTIAMAGEMANAIWILGEDSPQEAVEYSLIFGAIKKMLAEAHDKLDGMSVHLRFLQEYPQGHWTAADSGKEIGAMFDPAARGLGGRFEPNGRPEPENVKSAEEAINPVRKVIVPSGVSVEVSFGPNAAANGGIGIADTADYLRQAADALEAAQAEVSSPEIIAPGSHSSNGNLHAESMRQ